MVVLEEDIGAAGGGVAEGVQDGGSEGSDALLVGEVLGGDEGGFGGFGFGVSDTNGSIFVAGAFGLEGGDNCDGRDVSAFGV